MSSRDTILVSRTLYQIGVVTLISSLIWVGIGIYGVSTKKVNIEVDKNTLAPISLELDQTVVSSLSKRLKIEEPIPSPSPTPASVLLIEEEVLSEPVAEEITTP